MLLRSLLAFGLLSSVANAGVHEVWWNITYVEGVSPDGLAERRVIGVNGTWPPPPLEVNTTDSLVVHATNGLDQPTSLHHHGMFFNSTSWMDGAVGVTECGIPPGGSFDYVIPVDTSGQWGTYWVHSHAKGQYVDGLRAPFLLHPPKEVHNYDEEFTVVLGDWYHDEHPDLLKQFISVSNPGGAEPVPDSALVYFASKGTYLPPTPNSLNPSPSPHPATNKVGFNENATLPFEPGKTYRLRVVNTSGFSAFFFWIDGHDMRIVEVDGTDVEESPIDLLSITVAQRYSVLVTARNDTGKEMKNWAIHANMDTDMFDTVPDGLQPNITTSITYNKNPTLPLTDLGFVDAYHDTHDLSLIPSFPEPLYLPTIDPRTNTSKPVKVIEVEVTFDTMDDGTNRAMFNGVTFNTPIVPGVFSVLSLGGDAGMGDDGNGTGVYGELSWVVSDGYGVDEQGEPDVVDVVIKNGDAGKHPFHLHGHKFQIISRATDYTSSDPELNPPLDEGALSLLRNPVRRDTVQIPSGESVRIRFRGDNPGVWFLHCHIEWHLEAGLALQIIEAPFLAQKRNTVPSVMYDHCRALNYKYEGNAAGHTGDEVGDLTGLPRGPWEQVLGWRGRGVGALVGCILSAVLGVVTVVWYSFGGGVTDEEVEREVRREVEEKRERRGRVGRVFGVGK